MPILLGLVTRHLKHKVAQLVYLTTLCSLHSANSVFFSYQINTSPYFFLTTNQHQPPGTAQRTTQDDRVQPVKNLLQDCHGRKPPIRKKQGNNLCQMFFETSTLKLKWHGSIVRTTSLAPNVIVFLHYQPRTSTDLTFLLRELIRKKKQSSTERR